MHQSKFCIQIQILQNIWFQCHASFNCTCFLIWDASINCTCFSLPGYKSVDSVPGLVDDYMAGNLKVDEFITHNKPIEEVNTAFDLMHAGERYVGIEF